LTKYKFKSLHFWYLKPVYYCKRVTGCSWHCCGCL